MAEGLFDTAPREVRDYFDRRPSVPTFDWRDIAPREHALAFTVAKTAGFEVIEDLRAAVRQAVVDRVPYEEFAANLRPLLERKGWWGRRPAGDPRTGRDVMATLGTPRRLRTIYWANVASAHAAGEWERIERNKDFLPYLVYVASTAERKRPLHLSWVGTTLPVDDPWWRTHYPPNGWNCRCGVRQVSGPAAERAPADKRQRPPLDEEPWRDRRNGQTRMIPAGIDPGWEHNPGLMRGREVSRLLAGALDRMEEPARRAAVARLVDHPATAAIARGKLGHDHERRTEQPMQEIGWLSMPVAVVTPEIAEELGATTTIARLSVADASKMIANRRSMDWEAVQEIIDTAIIRLRTEDKLALFALIEGKAYKLVLKATADGSEIYVNSVYRVRKVPGYAPIEGK